MRRASYHAARLAAAGGPNRYRRLERQRDARPRPDEPIPFTSGSHSHAHPVQSDRTHHFAALGPATPEEQHVNEDWWLADKGDVEEKKTRSQPASCEMRMVWMEAAIVPRQTSPASVPTCTAAVVHRLSRRPRERCGLRGSLRLRCLEWGRCSQGCWLSKLTASPAAARIGVAVLRGRR